jgi:hypothetical protein
MEGQVAMCFTVLDLSEVLRYSLLEDLMEVFGDCLIQEDTLIFLLLDVSDDFDRLANRQNVLYLLSQEDRD